MTPNALERRLDRLEGLLASPSQTDLQIGAMTDDELNAAIVRLFAERAGDARLNAALTQLFIDRIGHEAVDTADAPIVLE